MKRTCLLLAMLFAALSFAIAQTPALGNYPTTSLIAISTAVGSLPNAIAVADLNEDGRQDLIVANVGTSYTSVVFGNGTGAFAGTTTIPTGSGPGSVAIGDFNNDGKPDFVTAKQMPVQHRCDCSP